MCTPLYLHNQSKPTYFASLLLAPENPARDVAGFSGVLKSLLSSFFLGGLSAFGLGLGLGGKHRADGVGA